jgi:hypothetical protein
VCSKRLNRTENTFDGDDQLWDDRKDLVASFLEEIVGSQNGEGTIGVELLSGAIKEDGKIVVIVQGLN